MLVGEHDFSSFRAVGMPVARRRCATCHGIDGGARPVSTIDILVRANAFLHHMVRNIAGRLLAVGRGDRPVDWIAEVLAARDRTLGRRHGAAAGLYFAGVEYPRRVRAAIG